VAEQGLTPAPAGLSDYIDLAGAAADRAAAAVGGYEDRFYELAGLTLRLRFAGPALIPRLAPALAHLSSAPVELAALTVRLFDTASAGVAPPPAPWGAEVFDDFVRVEASIDGAFAGAFHPGTFVVYRPRHDQALYWVEAPEDVLVAETGSPFQGILHLWLATRGVQVAHGAAVGGPDGCVMIVGHGGAGKSSTALACLDAGLGLIGEDYCLLTGGEPPTVHSLYSSAKANAATLERLPFLAPMVSNPDRTAGEKALCLLAEHVPDRLVRAAPLRAIAIPRITPGSETTVEPASPAAALAALAPSTLLQLRGTDGAALTRLARAVRSVPCHHLNLGSDPAGVAMACRSLLTA
jgi:hypothetical protein